MAVNRNEFPIAFESIVHQVRVTVGDSPTEWVEAIGRAWALSCAEDRTVEPLDIL